MLLIENGDIHTPAPAGRASILACGGIIERIGAIDGDTLAKHVALERLDASDCIVVPALIDVHAHLIGGSGEQGWASQTPAIAASELVTAGITTVVGTLGTDTTTRTMPALLAAVKALRDEGLSAFAWTGGYDARPLTRSIRDDLILIDELIGAGELAISDRRANELTPRDLARLATDCYIAGTLTGKAGLLHLHVGDATRRLQPLRTMVHEYDVEPSWLYATHVERNEELMAEAIELSRRGMAIDVDVYDEDLARWVRFHRAHGGDPDLLTASSDAAIRSPGTLLEQLVGCARDGVVSLEEALALATRNPARILELHDRGELARGRRADLLLLDRESLALRSVVCGGRVMLRDGVLQFRERFLAESNREIHLIGAKRRGNHKDEKDSSEENSGSEAKLP